ncbi:MAG: nuclear transport factor 2 family protein [Acidobacteriaceae bacterium]
MNLFRLRGLYLIAAGAVAAGLLILWISPLRADDHAVLVPINLLFDGMAKRNPSAIEASAIPGATFVSMRYGALEQMTFEQFAQRVGMGTTHIDERIHDPLVRVDNDLAVVWAPFEFRIDGKLDHCGTDLFSLVRNEGKWLIGSLSATLRKDCGTN